MASDNGIYGWFDDPEQSLPSYDPPRDASCLFCGNAIRADDVRTHSLMVPEEYASRSYFYRTHRSCAESADHHVDEVVFQMIAQNGD